MAPMTSSDALQYRRADAGDEPGLKRCIDAAYAIYHDRVSDLPDVSGGLGEDIQNNLVFVALIHAQIVGGIILVPHAQHLHVANLAVSPDHMGHGIGRHLLAIAEDEAKGLGVSHMQLSTHVAMPENVTFYTRLGWQETERTGNKVTMGKAL
jgi:GNAT superfamily N-acetyltransferase